MLPDRISNPGPLTYESGVLPIALRGPACSKGWIYKSAVISDHSSSNHPTFDVVAPRQVITN